MPPSFPATVAWMTLQLDVALICKLRGSLVGLAYFLTCFPWDFVQPGIGRPPFDWYRNQMSVVLLVPTVIVTCMLFVIVLFKIQSINYTILYTLQCIILKTAICPVTSPWALCDLEHGILITITLSAISRRNREKAVVNAVRKRSVRRKPPSTNHWLHSPNIQAVIKVTPNHTAIREGL